MNEYEPAARLLTAIIYLAASIINRNKKNR